MENRTQKYLFLFFIFCVLLVGLILFIGNMPVDNHVNDNVIRFQSWHSETSGIGPTVSTTSKHLVISLPPGSAGTADGSFSGGIVSEFSLRGDFDVQIDYTLLDWPPFNGVRIAIGARNNPLSGISNAMERTSFSRQEHMQGSENYVTDFGNPIVTATNDTSGKLRIIRTGSTWSSYYFSGGVWNLQYNYSKGYTSDAYIYLGAWSHDSEFIHKTVQVGLDNFQVNKGQVIWPDSPPPL